MNYREFLDAREKALREARVLAHSDRAEHRS
jgi:hypothetical protein